MVVKRRKKTTKYHAHVTHGGGSRKKRRGAGSRGGRGNAGTGKRASHKKAGISRKLGSKGFTRRGREKTRENALNVSTLTVPFVENLVAQGKATKEGNTYTINLTELGYTKLLGTGTVAVALHLSVSKCSARAAEKVEQAGGNVSTEKVGEPAEA